MKQGSFSHNHDRPSDNTDSVERLSEEREGKIYHVDTLDRADSWPEPGGSCWSETSSHCSEQCTI